MNTKKLTYAGLMTALVFVATALIPQIPVPFTEGYIHVGDSMIFVAAILFGWKFGAVVGGIGSSLADVFLGFTHWALPTLIIKGVMGAIIGFMGKSSQNTIVIKIKNVFAFIITAMWILSGFYIKHLLNSVKGSKTEDFLVNLFKLEGSQKLHSMIAGVQNTVVAAGICIPIFVIILSYFLNKKDTDLFSFSSFMGITFAGLWMIAGYYIAGGIMKGNMIVPIFSIPSNLLQFIGSILIAYAILIPLRKVKTNWD